MGSGEARFTPEGQGLRSTAGSYAVKKANGKWHCTGCGGPILKMLGDGKKWGCKGGLEWDMNEFESLKTVEIDHLGNYVEKVHNVQEHP